MKMKLHAELIFIFRLALKQRRKKTQKCPVKYIVIYFLLCITEHFGLLMLQPKFTRVKQQRKTPSFNNSRCFIVIWFDQFKGFFLFSTQPLKLLMFQATSKLSLKYHHPTSRQSSNKVQSIIDINKLFIYKEHNFLQSKNTKTRHYNNLCRKPHPLLTDSINIILIVQNVYNRFLT